ncbi:TPA: hypothetical protein EYO12_03270 [Candidatus Saccharibacteria bacterium]|nr:hypothetical protein [Candidatus Saccharibacteria bacterium]HIO87946.1 hypothetical protein [Candidatus Saccharibacteria bacterium]
MPRTVKTSVTVTRPLEEVWRVVTSDDNLQQKRNKWIREIVKLEDNENNNAKATYRTLMRFLFFKDEIVSEITYTAPTKVSWITAPSKGPITGKGHYELQEGKTPNTTRLTFTQNIEPANLVGFFLMPVLSLTIRRFVKKNLIQLKRLVENSPEDRVA